MSAGPGYVDAQGVRLFGEADVEGLASDMLNLGMDSVSDAFVLDRIRLTALEAATRHATSYANLPSTGNWLGREMITTDTGYNWRWNGTGWKVQPGVIIPTLPVNCTVSASGLITVSNKTSFSFDVGSLYEQIQIDSFDIASTAATDPTLRLLNTATLPTPTPLATLYSGSSLSASGASAPTGLAGATTSWPLGRVAPVGGVYEGRITRGAATSGVKSYSYRSFDSDALQRSGSGRNTSTTAHTAIQIDSPAALYATFLIRGLVAA